MLLKGPDTLVATPGEPLRVVETAVPGLATAGAGDVLSGVVGALLARGLGTADALSLAAAAHGAAAARAAGEHGTFTASDLERPLGAPARGMTRLRVEADEQAIAANARRLSQVLGRAELWAVVKADGYGHGAVRSARAAIAGGATRVTVATLDEGQALRESIGGCGPRPRARAARAGARARGARARALHLDAARSRAARRGGVPRSRAREGRHRDGTLGPVARGRAGARPVARRAASIAGLELAGLMSHLAVAEAEDTDVHRAAGRALRRARGGLPAVPAPSRELGRSALPPEHATSTQHAAASRSTASRRTTAMPGRTGWPPSCGSRAASSRCARWPRARARATAGA